MMELGRSAPTLLPAAPPARATGSSGQGPTNSAARRWVLSVFSPCYFLPEKSVQTPNFSGKSLVFARGSLPVSIRKLPCFAAPGPSNVNVITPDRRLERAPSPAHAHAVLTDHRGGDHVPALVSVGALSGVPLYRMRRPADARSSSGRRGEQSDPSALMPLMRRK